jgi:mannose-6-phosphate isomerase-like protein (cupin superfamily)
METVSEPKRESYGPTAYEKWQQTEGIPVIKGYHVEDVKTLPLGPWKRKGGSGAFLNLSRSERVNDTYICEIPPGGDLKPQRHLFEEMIYVVSGRGATSIWNEGEPKQTFEWQAGSLFSPPLNTWHQHFNGQGDKPVRYVAMTCAPQVINLFNTLDFVFNNNYVFHDRFKSEEDYFSSQGKMGPELLWESNFIPDVPGIKLMSWGVKGAGMHAIFFHLSNNNSFAHISEWPVGTYQKAHRHGPGAQIIIVKGKGYSLMWPEGQPKVKIDWHEGSIFSPPDRWFHQHFNAGSGPTRFIAMHFGGGKRFRTGEKWRGVESTKTGGDQIEYEDEDPEIRQQYERELAKEGLAIEMGGSPASH